MPIAIRQCAFGAAKLPIPAISKQSSYSLRSLTKVVAYILLADYEPTLKSQTKKSDYWGSVFNINKSGISQAKFLSNNYQIFSEISTKIQHFLGLKS
jgi:hypothetical protein